MLSTLYFLLLSALNFSCILFTCPFFLVFCFSKICEKCCESSIFWAIWAYKLVCLLDVTLKKDQKTWLLVYDSAWFWGACYSARLYQLRRSFVVWHLYWGLAFEILRRGRGFAGIWSLVFGAQRIVLLQFSILSGDQDLFYGKRKDNIHNWAQKVYSRRWYSWRCCRQTLPWKKILSSHSAQSWWRLGDKFPSYYSISPFGRPSVNKKQ